MGVYGYGTSGGQIPEGYLKVKTLTTVFKQQFSKQQFFQVFEKQVEIECPKDISSRYGTPETPNSRFLSPNPTPETTDPKPETLHLEYGTSGGEIPEGYPKVKT